MEKILERFWDILTFFFGGVAQAFGQVLTGLFGSSNARYVKSLQPKVDAINALESKYEKYTEEQLREETERFRQRLNEGETLDDILIEAFAVCREGGKRFLGMRHYDVQLIGGMVLHSGAAAEMVTGEGKTLVATLPAYLNGLTGKGVHVVTVNDYLARRDMEWMAPLYMGLGLTVGAIQGDMNGPVGNRLRQEAYACDITYGTNNEFGFDYLRDNMRPAARGDDRFPKTYQQAQGKLHYAIIDEVDNILIDEARTPLIISGTAHQDAHRYADADRIARALKREEHFVVNEKDHTVTLTDVGIRVAEKMAGVESFYTIGNMDWPHLIDNALKAHYLYKIDVNYVVKEGKVIIVDEFTGRLMDGRQWSDGLHQAVEAKEGVKIKEETQTLATITLQNYFKLYEKICGMTGTAMTESEEFWKIYKLNVVAIPTNRKMQRIEYPDVIYSTEKFKWKAVAEEIEAYHRWDVVRLKNGDFVTGTIKNKTADEVSIASSEDGKVEKFAMSKVDLVQERGRPILVGTVSIEKSELLSGILDRRGIKHEVLNAKNHKREAEIIAQAGRRGAVTIATNMAGRGTDIVMGGNPETMAWAQLQDKYETRLDVPQEEWDALVEQVDREHQMQEQGELVKALGGLHVIGTERHDSRRIDLQLRGRCGRQGDPGSSRFYLSFEDDLIRIFAGPFVRRMLELGGLKDDMPIESSMVSRRIDSAQKKREESYFEMRKSLLEYDEVMDEQRKRIYRFRQRILDGVSCREIVVDMIQQTVEENLSNFLARDYGLEAFALYASGKFSVTLDPKLFRKLNFAEADKVAREEAERLTETEIMGSIDENLPISEDESDWNWGALARTANSRWNINVRETDLKAIGRDRVDEILVTKVREAIQRTDLSEGEPMIADDYHLRTAQAWVRTKYGIELDLESMKRAASNNSLVSEVTRLALARYDAKEAEYPVVAGIHHFDRSTPTQAQIDREGLTNWAASRFGASLNIDDLTGKQRDEIRDLLLSKSKTWQNQSREAVVELKAEVEKLVERGHVPLRGTNGAVNSLAEWFKNKTNAELPLESIEKLESEELQQRLESMVEDFYHPEMRRMERMVLLEVVDNAWKDHLLAMDYLRSAVSQRGMAQIDPKVEYKREGMRLFESLWNSIGEQVSDIVLRMEQVADVTARKAPTNTKAIHESASEAQRPAEANTDIGRQQQAAIESSQSREERRIDPIRNRGKKVGRNDPCPCGSGKKYKACCMRANAED
ncbi:MAG: SEC-C domain-containing protein [Pirellulaceae bacterium]|nr:SEC-C domain-containing protein [Pirellulaceae bacterium]